MVKPHSPVAECKLPSQSADGKKMIHSKVLPCDIASSPKSCSSSNSPDKVTSNVDGLRKRVTFSRKVTVKHVFHINDTSQKMRERYWMTAEEHTEIKNSCRATVMRMMCHKADIEDGSFCPRGLETKTKEGQKEKNRRKDAVKRAVLLQQQLQKDENMVDDEFLAAISSIKTKSSAEKARERALKDAEDAWIYLHEEVRTKQQRQLAENGIKVSQADGTSFLHFES